MANVAWPLTNHLARVLPRVRNRHLFMADLALVPLASILAFALRLDAAQITRYHQIMLIYAAASLVVKLIIFRILGLYSRFWQYASIDEAVLLGLCALMGSSIQGALFLGVLSPLHITTSIPRSVPLIDILTTLVMIAGPRLALRFGAQRARRWMRQNHSPAAPKRVLIAGAGDAGALVARELEANPQLGLVPVGFVDDDPVKQGVHIHRYRVLGTREDIPALARELYIDQVLIAMPTAPGDVIRDYMAVCDRAGVAVRIVPGMYELLQGRPDVRRIREVRIEDLLRREPVVTDTAQVAALLKGRRVLVTGAGGSIGSELCRQILRCAPEQLLLMGHGENSIFEIYHELRRSVSGEDGASPETALIPIIADVRFDDRLRSIFERYRPEVVFHAAAHKHVPLMEENPEDAISNNVLGTLNVVDASVQYGVTHLVLISTDKAVNPTSVMGATKRVAELIVQDAALQTGRCFVAVRFGNVLGSRGSVVPLFRKQILSGGPVTVTHPDVRRYFMTIPEAVQLVLQAAALGRGGEIFVLDMGEPIRIVDLARDLIRLSGLVPDRDIEIVYTGLRPGEKMFEELFLSGETYTRTRHEKIFVYQNGCDPGSEPQRRHDAQYALGVEARRQRIGHLVAAAARGDRSAIKEHLQALVPEYRPSGDMLAV